MRTALKRGVSLLEMLVAVGIFSVAFLAVIGVFPALGQAVARGRSLTLATQVAERVIEDQRGLSADSASSSAQAAWRAPVCSTFCSHQSCVSAKPCAVPNQRASGRSSALASQASASARAAAVQARKRVKVSVGGFGMGGPRAGWATRERHGKAPA